jgi:hypothetical protein
MLTLTVDFNALANGLVRGLQQDVVGDGDPRDGEPVELSDGEGNVAQGVLREVRDGLVFAEVDWATWSPGTILSPAPDGVSGKEREVILSATGDHIRPLVPTSKGKSGIASAQERLPVPA